MRRHFALPDVGTAWHDLVHDVDPRFGLHAFAACTMMSLRKSLRNGRVWIDHSVSFRYRQLPFLIGGGSGADGKSGLGAQKPEIPLKMRRQRTYW